MSLFSAQLCMQTVLSVFLVRDMAENGKHELHYTGWNLALASCQLQQNNQSLNKCHPNESRWFLAPKSGFLLCAISPELRGAFEPLVGCPMILVKTENLKNVTKTWTSAVFSRMRRAYLRSPDALRAANSWILGCWLMLVDNFLMFSIMWVDHQSRWVLFPATLFGPTSRSLRKGDKRLEQLWGPLPTAPVWAKSWFLSSWFWWTLTRQSLYLKEK